MIEAPIVIVPYDPSWPGAFNDERRALVEIIAPWIAGGIEHIGSTAVPGLAAKPVIDIMVAVETLEVSRPAIRVLEDAGYQYAPYRTDVCHWLCKPSLGFRTHHVHLVPHGSPLWRERIAFRNHLRAYPDVAAEYAALKQTLADVHRLDREAYTEAKGPFIRKITEMALRQARSPKSEV